MQTLRFIGRLLKTIQWNELFKNPKWFFTMHAPYTIKCLFEVLYVRPHYKNLYYNSKVYDGMSRNQFIKGNLLTLLSELGCLKRYKLEDPKCDRFRGYFTGYLDDEE